MLKINTDKAILFKINLIFGITYLLLGCSQSIIPDAQDSRIPSPVNPQLAETQQVPSLPTIGDATQMTPTMPTDSVPGLEGLIETAKADLSQRLSIPETQINLVEATEVGWSDSSLDCPQPGMDYLQVITPGYRIVLEAGGQAYEYHSNRDAYVIYCENPVPPFLPKP